MIEDIQFGGIFRCTFHDDRLLEDSTGRIMTAGSALKDKECVFLLFASLTPYCLDLSKKLADI